MHLIKKQARGSAAGEEKSRLEELQSGSSLRHPEVLAAAVLGRLGRERAPISVKAAVETAVRKIVADEVSRLASGAGLPRPALIEFYESEDDRTEAFVASLAEALAAIVDAAPKEETDGHAILTIDVPLASLLRDANGLLTGLLENCLKWSFDTQSRTPHIALGFALAEQVRERLLRGSGLTEKAARDNPYRLKWNLGQSSTETVETYFRGTPLHALLLTPVPLRLTDKIRMEHHHICSGAGGGKTQFLQSLFARDLNRPRGEAVGMVVIDSTTDFIRKLSRLKEFEDNDRLIIVDAADAEFPVSLNLFSIGDVALAELPLLERAQIKAAREKLYIYVLGALFGRELTQNMSTVLAYILDLMLSIKGATAFTLLQCLEDPDDFKGAIEALPRVARMFLQKEFADREFVRTRKLLAGRLYGALRNETFARMFAAKENKLDLYKALNDGKVILVSTSRETMQDYSETFGRFMIAQTLGAAFSRARIRDETQRRYSYLIIDECADYIDDNIGVLLTQTRKFRLGCVLAHQALEQLGDRQRDLVMSSTAVRMCGSTSAKDARFLAAEMRTSPEFILGQLKDEAGGRFATFVRGLTPEAVSHRFPFGVVEGRPQMSDAGYQRMLDANRSRIATPVSEIDDNDASGEDDAGDDPDDFSSRY